ncbi:MAG TPA: multiheme c-type cytochrome [Polyangiaceae bacterium]|jgi:hypothetical protein|nr:multiheme c-type cytochrome [Polyangiaceae bacterium]
MTPRSCRVFPALALVCLACSHDEPRKDVTTAPPLAEHLTGPETYCAECHPKHVDEWKSSAHAYSLHDPVFAAMVGFGQQQTKGELGGFCVQCHTPTGFRNGETDVSVDGAGDAGVYTQPITGLSQDAMDGVSCTVCHSIDKVNTVANADFDMATDGIRRAEIRDPDPNPKHSSIYSPLHEDTEMCGTCHVVVNSNRVALEQTHIEWVDSIFAGSKTCQDCHMPSRKDVAAVGHGERTVHDHAFVGADVSLLPEKDFPGYDDSRAKVETLLQSSAVLSASADPVAKTLTLQIQNLAGHALPSGATADRQMWVELIVTDGSGNRVFESGTLDENGDLRTSDPARTTQPGSDPALILYGQVMLFDPKVADPTSTEPARPVDFLWEPNAETSHLIPPSVTDRPSYDLSSLPAGSYSAAIRLLFRSFPPHVLRRLEAIAGLDPAVRDRVPTVEMASISVSFAL